MRPAEPTVALRANVPLAPLSTIGVGGPARWLTRAENVQDVAGAHQWCCERNVPLFVLAGGSNVIIADEGVDGLVLQMAVGGTAFTTRGDTTLLTVGAGEPWDDVVAAAVSRGLAGFECLSGIPGSVGGTPIQNVGAYGQEVAQTIDQIAVFDRCAGEMRALRAAECAFGYRTSRFKQHDAGRFIVCEVTFRLHGGAPTVAYPDVVAYLERNAIASPGLADVRHAVLAIRRGKGMVIDASDPDTRSVGSFFMNPVVTADVHARLAASLPDQRVPGFVLADGDVKVPAAWLIERSGVARGYAKGPVGVSSKHPLALVNRGGATARDVLALAVEIKRRVANRFGIWLRPEPVFVGFGKEDPDVAYLLHGW